MPPRVLLVEDDLVSRRLSSKFLQVSGCVIGVAVDGIGAVSKMELEKYDLVLMDIVMPKLDGISATNMIRRFDPATPIISMTSNAKPAEVMTYYSSGMNDILPKPFTRDGLMKMLEKHLMHLKHVKDFMTSIPRSLAEGITLPEGFMFSDATPSPNSLFNSGFLLSNGEMTAANTNDGNGSQVYGSTSTGGPVVTTASNYSHITPADAPQLLFGLGLGPPGSNPLTSLSSMNPAGSSSSNPASANPNHRAPSPSSIGLINPLYGLGLDPSQYPSLLQNLLGTSGEALDAMEFDASLLGDTMLGGIGDTLLTSFGGGGNGLVPALPSSGGPVASTGGSPVSATKPSSPSASTKVNPLKRNRPGEVDDDGAAGGAKRSRFEVVE